MRCQEVRHKIHDYLDVQLSVRELTAIQLHLDQCSECRELHQEYLWLREAVAARVTIPEMSSRHIWQEIQSQRTRTWKTLLADSWDYLYTLWRDTDRKYIWSKVYAAPVTFLFFALLFGHFAPAEIQPYTFHVFSLEDWPGDNRDVLTVEAVEVEQNRSQIQNLVEAAWKLPYEDSLSLIAEITPQGHARIDDVLIYPKSDDLLNAVDLTLKSARFENPSQVARQFVIYSFQKIDVWYDARTGL